MMNRLHHLFYFLALATMVLFIASCGSNRGEVTNPTPSPTPIPTPSPEPTPISIPNPTPPPLE
jgi:hypothetical protein